MSIFTKKTNFFNKVRETLTNLADTIDPDGLTPPNGSFYDDVSNSLGRIANIVGPDGPAEGSFYESVPENLERIADNWPQGIELQSLNVTNNGVFVPASPDYAYNYVNVNVPSIDNGYIPYVKTFNRKADISFTEKELQILNDNYILTTLTATANVGALAFPITIGSNAYLNDSCGWCAQFLLIYYFGSFSYNPSTFRINTLKVVYNSGTWELTTNVNDFWVDESPWTFTFYLTPEQYAEITG